MRSGFRAGLAVSLLLGHEPLHRRRHDFCPDRQPDYSRGRSRIRQNSGQRREFRPKSGDFSYDSASGSPPTPKRLVRPVTLTAVIQPRSSPRKWKKLARTNKSDKIIHWLSRLSQQPVRSRFCRVLISKMAFWDCGAWRSTERWRFGPAHRKRNCSRPRCSPVFLVLLCEERH